MFLFVYLPYSVERGNYNKNSKQRTMVGNNVLLVAVPFNRFKQSCMNCTDHNLCLLMVCDDRSL
jgi:hypothetical protein